MVTKKTVKKKVVAKFTPNKKKFCDYFLQSGNATQSYLKAFKTNNRGTAEVQAHRILREPKVVEFMEKRQAELDKKRFASIEEVQEFWAEVLRGMDREAGIRDRLKASEFIAKTKGAFIDRVEHSGQVTPVTITLNIPEDVKKYLK